MTKLQDSKTEWQKNFEKNATDQSLGTAVSRIAGFLRDATMTALFHRGITDAWVLAFRGPHFFRRYLGEGAVSQEFQSRWKHATDSDISALRSLFVLGSLCWMLLIAGLTGVFADFIEGAKPSSVSMSSMGVEYFFHPMILMMGCWFYFSFQTALLQKQEDFRTPAVAPVFLNLSMIIFTALAWWIQKPIYLSWGVAAGGISVLIYSARPWTWVHKKHPSLSFWKITSFSRPGRQHILWFLQLPLVLLPLSLLQWVTLLQMIAVAKLQQQGLPSYFYLCDRLLELPFSLFVVSPCVAMTKPLIQSQGNQQREIFIHGLFSILIWLGPSTLGLWMMSQDLVRILFQHGHFQFEEVLLTSQILKSLALQLFVLAAIRYWMTWFLVNKKHPFLRKVGILFILFQASLVLGLGKNLQQILDLSLLGASLFFLSLLMKSMDLRQDLIRMFVSRKFQKLIFAHVLLYLWLMAPTPALMRLVFAPIFYFILLFWMKVWSFRSKV